jgi:hypothetical protein
MEPISRSAKFFRRDEEVEGRATNSNPLRLKVREQIEAEGLSGLVEVFHEEGIDGVCGTSYGTRPAGTRINLHPLGGIGQRRSRSASAGRWR